MILGLVAELLLTVQRPAQQPVGVGDRDNAAGDDLAGEGISLAYLLDGVKYLLVGGVDSPGFPAGLLDVLEELLGMAERRILRGELLPHLDGRAFAVLDLHDRRAQLGHSGDLTSQPLRFLEIKGKLRDDIIAKYPFFAPAVIEKGTYSGLDHDVETIAVQACLVARRDMSEDEAYAVTKAIFENLEALGNAHAKARI